MLISQLILPMKSMLVGASMLVPGISGGTMAIILGFYDELIHAVSRFTQEPKKNTLFLGKFFLGSLLGILLFSRWMEYLLARFPFPMMYFFLGAVAGGIPVLIKKSAVHSFTPMVFVHVLLGISLVSSCTLIPQDLFLPGTGNGSASMLRLLLSGIIIAVALILPGISTSHILFMLGLYEATLTALREMDFTLLLPLMAGVAIGIVSITRALENLLTLHPQSTCLWIIGFVLGSVIKVFPGLPTGLDWIFCPVMAALGFLVLYKISFLSTE